jgi:hypothetical protein
MEQKKFLACEPEFSVNFSAPPEFSGGVMEKCLSTGANLPPSDYELGVLPLRHCSLVCRSNDNQSVSCWDFPAVSEVTGSRIFRPYLVVTFRDFPAISALTGSRIFRLYQVVTCRDFPAVSAVTGSRIFWPYL